MIQLYVKQVLQKMGRKGGAKNLSKIGINYNSAKQILYKDVKVINLNTLFELCNFLHCTPNDILTLHPNAPAVLSPNHPLLAIKKQAYEVAAMEIISTLPLHKIDIATKMLKELKENGE